MVSLWCYYCAKILKKTEACKAKTDASEVFALAEIIFALAESCPVRQIHPFTHFQPQFTHFQPQIKQEQHCCRQNNAFR
jgi:hypothetical protein